MMSDSQEARLTSLERWREAVDHERGVIMRDLGSFQATLDAISSQVSQLNLQVTTRLDGISDKLDDRPSRSEFDRDMDSIRAKTRIKPSLTKLDLILPGNIRVKLLGVSGITIVLALLLIASAIVFWILHK